MQNRLFIDKHDINTLTGMYIIEIDNDDFRDSIIENGKIDSFWIEKRISQVIQTNEKENKWILSGFYYPHGRSLTKEELIKTINSNDRKRHFRLLKLKELKLACKEFIKLSKKYAKSSRENSIKRNRK